MGFAPTAAATVIQPAQAFDVGTRPSMARPIASAASITSQLADHVIEPPDIVVVEGIKIVPKAAYCIEARDVVQLQVIGTPGRPLYGNYPVDSFGQVNLGPPYGAVPLAGLTIEESQAAIKQHLERRLPTVYVSVQLNKSTAHQQIEGQHLVGPDGKIQLGNYGRVTISGMTLEEAKAAIERHLEQFLEDPDVSLDVYAYSTKVYYVIEQTPAGNGVQRFAIEGQKTVADALAQVGGLNGIATKKVWIERPDPAAKSGRILEVDWQAIVRRRDGSTNHTLQSGDRVYVQDTRKGL
jgi:polysaccharide export outer membrane protein